MQSGSCGENLMWTLDDGGTLIISGEGDMNNYRYNSPWYKSARVKKIIIKHGVTSIGDCAFCSCDSLTSVTIPDSVTSIGDLAFCDCTSLTSVTIPDSVTSIGDLAFSCCGLTSVTIPDSVTSIDFQAFWGCKSLTSVTIPDSVTSIGNEAFFNCTNLKKIYYKAGSNFTGQLSYGNYAKLIPMTSAKDVWWQFDDGTLTVGCVCEVEDYSREVPPWNDYLDVIQRLVIESGITKISAHAFDNCPRLEMVTLPASVKTIGDFAFLFSFCGDFNVNGGRNVFWCVEGGVLVVKKNPDAVGDDFSIASVRCWRDVEKNIRGVKVEHGIKPTKCFSDWLFERVDGKQISFGE